MAVRFDNANDCLTATSGLPSGTALTVTWWAYVSVNRDTWGTMVAADRNGNPVSFDACNNGLATHLYANTDTQLFAAGTLTVTATSGLPVDRVNITATGNPTITPAGGVDGQILRINVAASGAARTVTLASAVRTTTGITTRTLDVPSGQVAMVALEYSTLINAWSLTATAVTAT
ncbi:MULTISPECIES: hypothetical protein [Pseudonocardia]|uniref:Uncharacterized protein n=2 Tax=Pseudonocardia TaxID=1847 RepID=A0A1Y2N662_PSEAH|nr:MULTISPECIES: hypothetical protein [Pseudonocardia]OSY42965.1 hypothetical protein BG845_01207 [Pseudonocardia autotrophica]TDN77541.1 hypothetical protein C8E95_6789 [Pseudonocardia autotrophica]BBG01569.1 hypothetical protein Pdca_27780 [Pseudonocardia autotrophica]GEC29082.1 hypothetical protein PSA01_61110 [Pseudonocardia saturnea]